MTKNSLGLIETLGLVGAIEAADAGSKAANVTFRGYQRGRAGLITVVFAGDVAAVRAAVAAGTAAAKRVGQVVAVHVIARPDRQVRIGSPNGHGAVQLEASVPQEAVTVEVPLTPQETVEPEEQPPAPLEIIEPEEQPPERVAEESAPHEEPVAETLSATVAPSPDETGGLSAMPEHSAVAVAEAEEPAAAQPLEEAVEPEPGQEREEVISTGGNGDAPVAKAKTTTDVPAPARKKEKVRPSKAKRKL